MERAQILHLAVFRVEILPAPLARRENERIFLHQLRVQTGEWVGSL